MRKLIFTTAAILIAGATFATTSAQATFSGVQLHALALYAAGTEDTRRAAGQIQHEADLALTKPRLEQKLAIPLELVQLAWRDTSLNMLNLTLRAPLWWDGRVWFVGSQ